ncbi:MAG TPA: hypothetical protein DEB06_02655 [Phycisphaerales bacterium]|nr:hypothetical protein [Phycisphaerales bacterium]
MAFSAFVSVVLVLLALDLGVFHRHAHTVSMKEALGWTALWICLALVFNVGLYFLYEHHVLGLGQGVPVLGSPGETRLVQGAEAAKTFFAAYVLEKSLSMDNIFVIAVVFTSLGIPSQFQHRVLFWGIVGALVMRGAMIVAGTALINHVSWIVYVFGGVLILTAIKMALIRESAQDPAASRVIGAMKRLIPLTDRFEGQKFFTRIDGKRFATPLFAALVLVEFTDLVFAIDSIPAVFSITADPFIVFTSNVMAILGLRSLYFCLASMITKFRYLKPALIVVLAFAGVKMCLVHTPLKVPMDVSLFVILGVLGLGVASSLIADRVWAASPEPEGEGGGG